MDSAAAREALVSLLEGQQRDAECDRRDRAQDLHDEVRGGRGLVAEAPLVVLPVFLARDDLFVDSTEGSQNAAHRADEANVLFVDELECLSISFDVSTAWAPGAEQARHA